MKEKRNRLEAIKMLISSKELGNQDELLKELLAAGFSLTQATLSRDLKQLKVAKAASMNGKYMYVLPNETMYARVRKPMTTAEMLKNSGFLSLTFSGNLGVIKTKPGYASALAFNIDSNNIPEILGTIAGDDTIIMVIKEGITKDQMMHILGLYVPDIKIVQ